MAEVLSARVLRRLKEELKVGFIRQRGSTSDYTITRTYLRPLRNDDRVDFK